MKNDTRAWAVDQLNVSRETLERLDIYASLLERWTQKINLVSAQTVEQLWTRHFLDSAQLLDMAPSASKWVDLGSGGGFPGAVVAVLSVEKRPGLDVSMIEADQRKAAFLRAVLRETGVAATVIAERIEDVPPLKADVLSARALAPLPKLLEFASLHLANDGRALFLKGQKADAEVRDALERWRFDCETYTSKTDPEAVVLSIGDIQRV